MRQDEVQRRLTVVMRNMGGQKSREQSLTSLLMSAMLITGSQRTLSVLTLTF
jgi:hypothetical protein